MGRIEKTFARLGRDGRTALMPYLTMGYPEAKSALELVPAIAQAGADLVELGVPFSDPLADGATIQASSQRALENGMTLELCLEQAATLRERGVKVPFVMMGYYNPIFQMGVETFAYRAAQAGVDGAIVPDLPPEEADGLRTALHTRGIDLVFLLAPTAGLSSEAMTVLVFCSNGSRMATPKLASRPAPWWPAFMMPSPAPVMTIQLFSLIWLANWRADW